MGCCQKNSRTEQTIIQFLSELKLADMSHTDLNNLLDLNSANYKLIQQQNISARSLSLLEKSQENISTDSFMKIAIENFIIGENESESPMIRNLQIDFLQKIILLAESKRDVVVFLLYPILKNSINFNIEEFCALLRKCSIGVKGSMKYSDLKRNLLIFYSCQIKTPYESICSASHDTRLIDEAQYYLDNMVTNTNLNNFVNKLLEDFEKDNFFNEPDLYNRDNFVIEDRHIEMIFSKRSNLISDVGFIRWSFISDLE